MTAAAARYLYLTRHGEASEDESKLTDTGRHQAVLLGKRLREAPFTTVHHGPLACAEQNSATGLRAAQRCRPAILRDGRRLHPLHAATRGAAAGIGRRRGRPLGPVPGRGAREGPGAGPGGSRTVHPALSLVTSRATTCRHPRLPHRLAAPGRPGVTLDGHQPRQCGTHRHPPCTRPASVRAVPQRHGPLSRRPSLDRLPARTPRPSTAPLRRRAAAGGDRGRAGDGSVRPVPLPLADGRAGGLGVRKLQVDEGVEAVLDDGRGTLFDRLAETLARETAEGGMRHGRSDQLGVRTMRTRAASSAPRPPGGDVRPAPEAGAARWGALLRSCRPGTPRRPASRCS